MIKKTFYISILIIFLNNQALAMVQPRSLATDQRIKVVAYQKDNIVPIHGTTFITTQIIFGQNEQIIAVDGGDASAWTINVDKYLQNILNIKPTILDSDSNLSVITRASSGKKRYYHFELTSNKNPTADPADETYAIQFVYPDEEKARLLRSLHYKQQQQRALINHSKDPKDYNWNYSFYGDKRIVPEHVFDDGKFTYLQLLPEQSIPAIFAVDNAKGKESVVNFRRKGQYLIIQRMAPQFTLRDGKYIVASIFNNNEIRKLRNNNEA